MEALKPGDSRAYRGYLITAARSGIWGDPLFYITKDECHIGSETTLEKAKKTIDLLID